MKKILFVLLLMTCSTMINAQEKQKLHRTYMELLGYGNVFDTKADVYLDFGQHDNYWTGMPNTTVINEKGKRIDFNNMVDAMNYMSERGWNFVQSCFAKDGNKTVYRWLLCKDFADKSEIMKRLTVKQDMKEKKKAEKKYKEDINDPNTSAYWDE